VPLFRRPCVTSRAGQRAVAQTPLAEAELGLVFRGVKRGERLLHPFHCRSSCTTRCRMSARALSCPRNSLSRGHHRITVSDIFTGKYISGGAQAPGDAGGGRSPPRGDNESSWANEFELRWFNYPVTTWLEGAGVTKNKPVINYCLAKGIPLPGKAKLTKAAAPAVVLGRGQRVASRTRKRGGGHGR